MAIVRGMTRVAPHEGPDLASDTARHILTTTHGRFNHPTAAGTFGYTNLGTIIFGDVVMDQVFSAFGALQSCYTHAALFTCKICHSWIPSFNYRSISIQIDGDWGIQPTETYLIGVPNHILERLTPRFVNINTVERKQIEIHMEIQHRACTLNKHHRAQRA